ncbi:autotransporter assembly complex family protein [Acinetobacter sp. MD2(2019)]|uniref:autotransporter assembly complex protein TamA n=1 Tax=Acinetobacter sp. MD2(2019) TaxID=2605273 RepID=UPI002D1ECF09|nr:autotransporter assembly complex family protein [Acinetobacter sp. MD2(2019)]MEB3754768.1 outer membrane protein assembly factor [Acinetobacter sp. MD2(2019)]
MHVKTHFKKMLLTQSLQSILKKTAVHQSMCTGLFLCICSSSIMAQDANNTSDASNPSSSTLANTGAVDSLQMLQQQQQNPQLAEFKKITLDDLDQLPAPSANPSMLDEINRQAEQAKQEALNQRLGHTPIQPIAVQASSAVDADVPAVNVDQVIQKVQQESHIDIAAVDQKQNASVLNDASFDLDTSAAPEKSRIKRWINKIRPRNAMNTMVSTPKINVAVEGAPTELAENISNKLSSFTQESFDDYNSALPQLRAMAIQAAQAMGYYDAKFQFKRTADHGLKVAVVPNEPVKVASENIDITGAGAMTPQFQLIRLIPDLAVGDVLNHGLYEQMKAKIIDTASDNGFFDAYWRLRDVKVQLPDNTADINLRYETGERYKIDNVEFKMSDPSKPLPLKLKVLQSMVPWEAGDDYTFWRVNTLANNLTNSRYFNWSLVESVKPDPIQKPLELPPDVQAYVDQQQITSGQAIAQVQDKNAKQSIVSATEVSQNVVNENQFAGTQIAQTEEQKQLTAQHEQEKTDKQKMQEKARAEKTIPVVVTLNADKLNSAELGAGWGTDTGARIRAQYRRAIVNSSGHSFDANMEVSQIRQAIDTRYSIPYKHPLNDYFNILGGYEREEFKGVGPGMSLTTESAVVGAERVIKNPLGHWQQNYGVRYRLDQITQNGQVNTADVPDAFLKPGSNPQQQALLLGYQLSRTDSNDPVNPTKGFKQSYKIQLGSKSVLSDANMAIANVDWGFIYSLGENYNHQFIASASLGYIFTDDFANVPYNLRFFAGGDQSIRGFDYKSLSPTEDGYKIGGQALAIGSLEYNYQFKPGWRAALFTDVGNAFDSQFSNPTAYSVGLGVRWQSPIGPIRLDVASGISDEGHPIRIHFFIGSQL